MYEATSLARVNQLCGVLREYNAKEVGKLSTVTRRETHFQSRMTDES